jgi:3-oxoacyl-[acyl-carrier protein] reductase
MPEKVAVVTGSSAGIGRSMAIAFARKITSLSEMQGTKTIGQKALFQNSTNIPNNRHSSQAIFQARLQHPNFAVSWRGWFPKLDVLINNAGRTEPTSITSFNGKEWRSQFDANFFSVVFVTNGLLTLVQKCNGSIVNISSVRGLFDTGREGVMAYSAAKAALNSFTKTLAKALAPNVTVNAILPGFTATTYLERAPAEQVAMWKESSAIQRFIEPGEIADITVSVAENRAITGSLVLVDGGLALRRG